MRKEYLSGVTDLLQVVHPTLAFTHKLEFKNCFGAVAGYVDGRIFISCGKFGVALRLPPETRESLFEDEEVEHLRYFPNGHIKKEYAVLPQRIIGNHEWFKELIDKSIGYAGYSQAHRTGHFRTKHS
jgi:hypothetical protein